MKINKVQPSFGMAIRTKNPRALDNFIFNNLGPKDTVAYRYIQTNSENCPVDVYLSVINKNGKERLQAEVGSKTFVSGFFKSPIRVIKQASIEARNLEK